MTTQQVQEYLVLPTGAAPGDADWIYFIVRVINTGGDRWKVVHQSAALHTNRKKWDHEPQPSSRTDFWLTKHRFSHVEALEAAHAVVDTITMMGRNWPDYQAWAADRLAQKNQPSGS